MENSKYTSWVPVTILSLAAVEVVIAATVSLLYYNHIKSVPFAGIWLVMGMVGTTICAIQYAEHRKIIPMEAQSIIARLFMTVGFFVIALGWALKK
jgi:hypothetical protein